MATYKILEKNGSKVFHCCICNQMSYNINDLENKYCKNCHIFHDERNIDNPMFYDKEGDLINSYKVVFATMSNMDYRRVAETTLENGTYISTVLLGIDHNFSGGKPLIFETMAFPNKEELHDFDVNRYATLEESKIGHEEMVRKWKKNK